MSGNRIRIDRLKIRLKGDSNSARELGASIGSEILEQIAQQTRVTRNRPSIDTKIGHVDAGTLRVGSEARAAASSTAIARQIAARVSSKIAPVMSRRRG